jgi:hypothetical protein
MDSTMTDHSNIKLQLNEFLDKSLGNLDRRSILITKELERIREEYVTIIEKGRFYLKQLMTFSKILILQYSSERSAQVQPPHPVLSLPDLFCQVRTLVITHY